MKNTIFAILVFPLLLACNGNNSVKNSASGYVLGTTYHIKYYTEEDENIQNSLDSIYNAVVKSMSTYIDVSDISKINRGDDSIVVDHMFKEVYDLSVQINRESKGMFDPTIGIIVNAWGFGPKRLSQQLDSAKVNELMQYVGIEKTSIDENGVFHKQYKETQIDFNAIAKGYTLDRVAAYFDSRSIDNYLIEIGGEVIAKGIDLNDNSDWTVGVDEPSDNNYGGRQFVAIVKLKNISMATSGNYRNFRIDSLTGEKFVHTMNARTGYPSRSNMLSATVFASDCATADAYATTFMAMGLSESVEFLNRHPELDAFLVYLNDKGEYGTYRTKYMIEHTVK